MLRKIYLVAFCLALLSGCGYTTLQTAGEAIKASLGEVLNQYQHRADLIPGLVNTVKGYASYEQEVLTEVANVRARIAAMQATSELVNDEDVFKEYMAAQGDMNSALSQLMLVAKSYPELKGDGVFRDLQAQLEDAESRITVARNRYTQSVQDYNNMVRGFPSNLTAKVFGFVARPIFSLESEAAISTPPSVDLGGSEPGPGVPSEPAPFSGSD